MNASTSQERRLTANAAAMDPDEWKARVDLAACYRLHALYGWTAGRI